MTIAASSRSLRETIYPGAILMREGINIPTSLLLDVESYSAGWMSIAGPDSYEIDKRVRKSGWTFFFMAALIKSTVFGFDRDESTRTAVRNLMRDALAERCNALEIENVIAGRLLGVPYVRVSAHSRHFQQSMIFGRQ